MLDLQSLKDLLSECQGPTALNLDGLIISEGTLPLSQSEGKALSGAELL
jgi:hypothetical protein